MGLATGSRVAGYEIVEPLGAGGMGEVYRALDRRLGRTVALKILPSDVSSDPERLRRFEQEARTASALNHPSLVTVYDIGAEGDVQWIALELIEGATLRESLRPGPLPVRRLLDIAIAIADGLAAAHGAGIVHRDLKPENVIVARDGYVKILDFGLAKRVPESESVGHAETVTGATTPGMVLGTLGYLSPEQARGLGVDFRSDQFSFGVLLHEMATGRNPFRKETPADSVAAVLREDPDPLTRSNPAVPQHLSWIADRCIAKDPAERYASTLDLARDLRLVRDRLSEGSRVSPGPAPPPRRTRRRAFASLFVALAAGAAGFLAGRTYAPRVGSADLGLQQLTFRRGALWSARFGPDGQSIAFAAAWDGQPVELFGPGPGASGSQPLGLRNASLLSISSRGELAVLLEARPLLAHLHTGTLARVPLAGGEPRTVLTHVHAAEWSPDGAELAVAHRVAGKDRLEFPPGNVLYETTGFIGDLRFAPGGGRLAFFEHGAREAGVVLLEIGGRTKVLSAGFSPFSGGLAWRADGKEVWFSAGHDLALYAVDLDGNKRTLARVPGGLRLLDISPSGRVLAAHVDAEAGLRARVPGQAEERDLTWIGDPFLGDLASDATAVVFQATQAARRRDQLFLRNTDGSAPALLGEGFQYRPIRLSRDGYVLAQRTEPPRELVLLAVSGGLPRSLPKPSLRDIVDAAVLQDGRLVVAGNDASARPRIALVQPSGEERLLAGEGAEAIEVSPDVCWVAALGAEGGLSLSPLDPGAEPRQVPGSFQDETLIGWRADSRAVFVYRTGEVPARVQAVDIESGARTPLRELSPSDAAGVWRVHPVRITPDERGYAYSFDRMLSRLYLVEGLDAGAK